MSRNLNLNFHTSKHTSEKKVEHINTNIYAVINYNARRIASSTSYSYSSILHLKYFMSGILFFKMNGLIWTFFCLLWKINFFLLAGWSFLNCEKEMERNRKVFVVCYSHSMTFQHFNFLILFYSYFIYRLLVVYEICMQMSMLLGVHMIEVYWVFLRLKFCIF